MTAELADDGGNATHRVQVLDVQRACRCDTRDVRDLLAYLVPVIHGDGAAGSMGNGRKVKHGVGRTAEGHVKRHAIPDGVLVDDVECGDVFRNQLHNLHASVLCQANALGVHSRDGAVAGKGDAQTLGKAADGVSGEHARAAAAGRTCGVLKPLALLFGHGAGGYLAHGIEQGVQVGFIAALVATGKHRAARYQHRREVHAARSKKHAGNDLVARGDQDNAIEGMALHNAFYRVGDNLTAGKGIMHAVMVHGDAIANTDGGCCQRRTACHADAGLYRFGDLVQMVMAGNDVVLRRDNRDEWALQLFVGQSVSLQQASVRGTRETFLDRVASHLITPLSLLGSLAHVNGFENPSIKKSCAADCIRTTKKGESRSHGPITGPPIQPTDQLPNRRSSASNRRCSGRTAQRCLSDRPTIGFQQPPTLCGKDSSLLFLVFAFQR